MFENSSYFYVCRSLISKNKIFSIQIMDQQDTKIIRTDTEMVTIHTHCTDTMARDYLARFNGNFPAVFYIIVEN